MYASDTSVPIERSQAEIEKLLRSHGAEKFMRGEDGNREVIACWLHSRQLMFELPLPDPAKFKSQERQARQRRALWRALLLCIKAKFIAVDAGVESFEDAFLAQIVVPTDDGRSSRMGRVASKAIALAYEKGAVPNFGFAGLLPSGG